MNSKQTLVSFYIKDGAQKLVEFVDSTLNKKKPKKNIQQQNIAYHPSIYNFVVIKPHINKICNITNQEIIKNLQGKTRSSLLYKNQENVYLKDIQAFQILYNKYLKCPQTEIDFNQQAIMNKAIKTRVQMRLFSPYLQDTELDELMLKASESTEKVKRVARLAIKQIYKSTQQTLLLHRSERQNFEYYTQMQRQRQLSLKQFYQHDIKFQRQGQSEQICAKIINQTIFRWLSQLIEILNLKELLINPQIIVEWPNNFIQHEKQQLLAQQINGKLLFSVEQNITQIVESTKQLDFAKEFHLRQKRYGVHSNNQNANKYQKDRYMKPNQKVSVVSFEDKAKMAIPDKKIRGQTNKQELMHDMSKMRGQSSKSSSYSQIANRLSNLRRNSGKNLQNASSRQINEAPRSCSSSSHENSKQSNSYNMRFIPFKKPTPLKYDNLSQYKFKNDANLKPPINNLNNRLNLKSIPAQQNRAKNTASKVQVKFPLKIEHFEMNSWTESFICYKAEQLNLKELPLTFMKDRHKFGQNRVKIEYPCRPQAIIIQIVYKSMQILNCFGAQVYCEEEASYRSVNEIDESQILAVSWIIERPVQEVIKYYGQYYGGCATKK